MSAIDEESVPSPVRRGVREVIDELIVRGFDYEDTLSALNLPQYEFIQPKSPYYRYYTHQLFEHGPTSRERAERGERIRIEGSIESVSVGAMVEIVKEEMRQGKKPYESHHDQTYLQEVQYHHNDHHLHSKVEALIQKYAHVVKKREVKESEGEKREEKREGKEAQKSTARMNELRKEMGGNQDGSMGVYGGKKYEGLGSRDEFANFRREKSQNYYSNLQEKSKQS